ncbi:MAG: phenylacetate--CoA ligase family protein [Gammaproteobacteria bacterium]
MYYDQKTETLPRQQLQQLQLAKLQKMLAEIDGKNAFYTKKFRQAGFKPEDLRSKEDISLLPFTIKTEFAEAQEADGFACNLTYPMSAYTRLHQTSGTTGAPLRVFDTADSWDWWGRCWAHVFAGAGVTADDRVFCAFSFGPFIGFWAAVGGARLIGALLVPGGGRSSIDRLHLMRETQCTVLCSTPSYALHLLEVANEHDFDLGDLKIHTTIHAGEPGANIPAVKQRIESSWGAKCHDHSGASEIGAYGFETRERPNGLYIIESEFIAEIINPENGAPVAFGEEGELVLTNLGRWGFPVIRYRTGDIVRPVATQESDRTFLYLDGGIIGRSDDMTTVRGVNIFPSAIDNFIRKFDEIIEYRTTVNKQGSMDELTIEIEIADSVDQTAVQEKLLDVIKTTLGLRPNIEIVDAGALPRFELKARRFHVLKQGSSAESVG